jgi:hypothetical protein
MLGSAAAAEPTRRTYFRDLADYREYLAVRGVAEADLNAIDALGRGFAIPAASWCLWFDEGSVNWETGQVVRILHGREVNFRPLLQSVQVDGLFPSIAPVNEPADTQAASIKTKLKDAKPDAIREAVRTVYAPYPPGEGPNLNEVVTPVQHLLETSGRKASKTRIQEIAAEREFEGTRGEVGKHRKRASSSPGK